MAPGLYDLLVTKQLEKLLADLNIGAAQLQEIGDLEAAEYLSKLIAKAKLLELRELEGDEQIDAANDLLESDEVAKPARVLKSIFVGPEPPVGPTTPLSQSGLILNAKDEPRLGFELEREMASSDEVWVIVSFLQWRGWLRIKEALLELERAGKPVKILTTTYMGASDYRALEAIARLSNVKLKVSLDGGRRRLHAKAWLFVRESGFSSAYVGSANLSGPALEDGIEWTVKLSEVEAPHVIEKFRGAFESHWNDGEFEEFDPCDENSARRLREALSIANGSGKKAITFFDLRPHAYQQSTLDRLEALRLDQGQKRNLVVAPTGTGKTLIAAFDYVRQPGARRRLLFLAHREELIRQARDVYRQVLRDESFGELLVGGESPSSYEFLFATVQSFGNRQLWKQMGESYWQFVVLDEAHHTAAASYREVLEPLQPDILLGLTATPERMDGESILPWFGGAIADEMRLWHAIERQYLVPFDYYGVHDGTDLSEISWRAGRYDIAELNQMLSWNERRAQVVIRQFEEIHADVTKAKALAFCVSIEHAEFMAEMLRKAGIAAEAITSKTEESVRRGAPQRLRDGKVNVLLSVDLFNEGIDIPVVDTILFLRPTESVTVFLQQLGRGLRRAPEKRHCLVIDFIGNQRREFRLDLRYRAMFGGTRQQVRQQLETGVTRLPGNCYFRLDREAQSAVLHNLQERLNTRRSRMIEELRNLADALGRKPGLQEFLKETSYELSDVYKDSIGGWTGLLEAAGQIRTLDGDLALSRQLKFLLHWDSPRRIAFARELRAPRDAGESKMELMMTHRLLQGRGSAMAESSDSARLRILGSVAIRQEFDELLEVLNRTVGIHRDEDFCREDWPLSLHRSYTLDEILTAVGHKEFGSKKRMSEGVLWIPDAATELLIVKLDKSEKRFSPTIRYRDYAISSTLFHWQSQSRTKSDSMVGLRYQNHMRLGVRILLFVQGSIGGPYVFLGDAQYVSHYGEKPMNITWQLKNALPPAFYEVCASFRVA